MTIEQNITNKIKQEAMRLGFNACGISKPEYLEEESKRLKSWLNSGMHAEMKYMQNHFEKRTNPVKLVEGAKSIISVILNYFPSQFQKSGIPKISKYAYGKDYHIVVKDKLFFLLKYINENIKQVNGRAFVDSAPVMDKVWAAKSGLGWIGKNSCLINKEFGSYVFIGELIIDLELDYDAPINDYCGNCTKCIDACPTNAIVKPKVVDARKCISYYTIEHKNEIPEDLKDKFKNWIFGCDICQDVCPWNQKKAKPTEEKQFKILPEIENYTQEDWRNLREEKFNDIFKDSPVLRTKQNGALRNINFISKSNDSNQKQ